MVKKLRNKSFSIGYIISVAHLRGNVLRPRRECWEDRYKLNEWADERSGRCAYDGGAGNAVGVVTEFFNLISWIVTLGLLSSTMQTKSPTLRCCSAGLCHLDLRFSAGTYSLSQRAQIALAVGLCTGVPLKMINLVEANNRRSSGCMATK